MLALRAYARIAYSSFVPLNEFHCRRLRVYKRRFLIVTDSVFTNVITLTEILLLKHKTQLLKFQCNGKAILKLSGPYSPNILFTMFLLWKAINTFIYLKKN